MSDHLDHWPHPALGRHAPPPHPHCLAKEGPGGGGATRGNPWVLGPCLRWDPAWSGGFLPHGADIYLLPRPTTGLPEAMWLRLGTGGTHHWADRTNADGPRGQERRSPAHDPGNARHPTNLQFAGIFPPAGAFPQPLSRGGGWGPVSGTLPFVTGASSTNQQGATGKPPGNAEILTPGHALVGRNSTLGFRNSVTLQGDLGHLPLPSSLKSSPLPKPTKLSLSPSARNNYYLSPGRLQPSPNWSLCFTPTLPSYRKDLWIFGKADHPPLPCLIPPPTPNPSLPLGFK